MTTNARSLNGFYWDPIKQRYFPLSQAKKHRNDRLEKDKQKQIDFLPSHSTSLYFHNKSAPLNIASIRKDIFAKGCFFHRNELLCMFNKLTRKFEFFVPSQQARSHPFHFDLLLSPLSTANFLLDNTITSDRNNFFEETSLFERDFPTSILTDPILFQNDKIFGAIDVSFAYFHLDNLRNCLFQFSNVNCHFLQRDRTYIGECGNVYCVDLNGQLFDLFKSRSSDILTIESPSDNLIYFANRKGDVFMKDTRDSSPKTLFNEPDKAINALKILPNEFVMVYSCSNDDVYAVDLRFLTKGHLFELLHFKDLDWSSNVSMKNEIVCSPVESSCFYVTRNNKRAFAKYSILSDSSALDRVCGNIHFATVHEDEIFLFES